MKKGIFIFLFLTLCVLPSSDTYPWARYDRVLAVVNSRAIIESDILNKLKYLQQSRKISGSRLGYEMSRIIDRQIEAELIFETAQKESILISEKKIVNQLENSIAKFFSTRIESGKKLNEVIERVSKNFEEILKEKVYSENNTDSDLKKFIDYLEKRERKDIFSIVEEIRLNIAREQVMSIAIGTTPPSADDAKKWFNANRGKLGYEIHAKHILIIPRSSSLTDEKEANNKADEIRKKIMSGESFESLAGKYSQDPGSAANGGDIGWAILAQLDPYFAGNVMQLSKPGQVSGVFRSNFGYHIAKFLGKRAVTYDKVEKMIMYKLYQENMYKQFVKWIKQKKEEATVKIYFENYVKG